MGWLDFLFKPGPKTKGDDDYTDEELSEIAGRGTALSGRMYSEESIYKAFIDAGLPPEKAKEETAKRIWHID